MSSIKLSLKIEGKIYNFEVGYYYEPEDTENGIMQEEYTIESVELIISDQNDNSITTDITFLLSEEIYDKLTDLLYEGKTSDEN